MHEPTPTSNARPCIGHIDSMEKIQGDSRFLRINGWWLNAQHSEMLKLISANHNVVGIILSGLHRPDVEMVVGKPAQLSGFAGYILADAPLAEVFGQTAGVICRFEGRR
jgi:hypothetical protein